MTGAWQSFLHPRRTSRLLVEAEAEVARLREQVAGIAALKSELEKVNAELAEAHSRADILAGETIELRQLLDSERAAHEHDLADIREIQGMCDRVGELVERYENRIARLTRLLDDARRDLNRMALAADEELTPLPPLRPAPPAPSLDEAPPPLADSDLDWYTTPPEL